MDKAAKPTALFFGFLAASMTYVSAQATPQAAAERTVAAIQRDVGVAARQPSKVAGVRVARRASGLDRS